MLEQKKNPLQDITRELQFKNTSNIPEKFSSL